MLATMPVKSTDFFKSDSGLILVSLVSLARTTQRHPASSVPCNAALDTCPYAPACCQVLAHGLAIAILSIWAHKTASPRHATFFIVDSDRRLREVSDTFAFDISSTFALYCT